MMASLRVTPIKVLLVASALLMSGILKVNVTMMKNLQALRQANTLRTMLQEGPPSASSSTTKPSLPYESPYTKYNAAPVEQYVLSHAKALGYQKFRNPPGCNIWKHPETTPYYNELQAFLNELEAYSKLVMDFVPVNKDLRELLEKNPENREETCQRLELHPDGIPALFPSRQISYSRAGYVEPLLPPMRHPKFCFDRKNNQNEKKENDNLLRMDYMIHDFAEMCRRLRPTSRTVFIDMGASLDFHKDLQSPAMYQNTLYRKFGFYFDHVYAFEMRPKNATQVYQRVPPELMASYHWINVGVNPEKKSSMNPLSSILQHFKKSDLIVVKLDVDTPKVEIPLAYQILRQANLYDMIDQFYFEHHVHMQEMAPHWRSSMKGTIDASLQLFHELREKGVAAHFWP